MLPGRRLASGGGGRQMLQPAWRKCTVARAWRATGDEPAATAGRQMAMAAAANASGKRRRLAAELISRNGRRRRGWWLARFAGAAARALAGERVALRLRRVDYDRRTSPAQRPSGFTKLLAANNKQTFAAMWPGGVAARPAIAWPTWQIINGKTHKSGNKSRNTGKRQILRAPAHN